MTIQQHDGQHTDLGEEATLLHHFIREWLQGYSLPDQQTWLIVLLREVFKDNPHALSPLIVLAAQQLGYEV